ncbi:MAG: CAP domain-containing protein [Nitrososphaerota archaeon]|nr:CAP domain-containing protein [Nitrososphaerota archaeon]
MNRRRGVQKFVYALFLSVIVLMIVFAFMLGPMFGATFTSVFSGVSAAIQYGPNGQTNATPGEPPLLYYNAPKPADYVTLAQYMLNLINNDRMANNVTSNVTLDYNPAAQQHAYSMLVNNYFSHWDTQGYKPYMRYTIAGGTGSVDENVAYEQYNGKFTNTAAVEQALKQMEYDMVYDDAGHNYGHRDNILDPYHNMVTIGVAYNLNYVYLVQDFENKLINWTQTPSLSSSGQVILSGSFPLSRSIQMVQIFYDPTPTPLTRQDLANPPYDGSYNQGTFVGGVVQPGFQVQGGTTVNPSIWQISSSSFIIAFNMKNVIATDGPGVYTIYIAFPPSGNHQETFTSLSFFVTNSST